MLALSTARWYDDDTFRQGGAALDWLQRAKRLYLVLSILLIALGLFLICRPAATLLTICYLLGILCLLFGGFKLIGYFSKGSYRTAFRFDLPLGILSLILGILLCWHPGNVVALLQFFIGSFILVDGVLKFQTALDARRCGLSRWWGILTAALLSAAAGLLLILNPFGGAKAMVVLLGVTLVVDGFQNLIVVLYTARHIRRNPDDDDLDIVFEE